MAELGTQGLSAMGRMLTLTSCCRCHHSCNSSEGWMGRKAGILC